MSFTSTHPDVEIPDVTVHDYVLDQISTHGSATALVDGINGAEYSYASLAESIAAMAGAFAARGIAKGDVVAIFSPNSTLYPIVFFGAIMAGATVTTVNALYTPREIGHQLTDAGAKILVTVSTFMDRAAPAAKEAGVTEILDEHTVQELLAAGHPAPSVGFDPASDVAVLPYSSGTTGLPKGVMLTHRHLVANLAQIRPLLQNTPEDKLVAILPFFHIYGMVVVMTSSLVTGSTVVTLPRFDLTQFLATLQNHRITKAFVAPPVILAMAKHPIVSDFDLSSLKLLFSGAAPLDADLAAAAASRLGVLVQQGYGMTELSPVSHAASYSEPATPYGTVGKLVPNTEARLVDVAAGEDVSIFDTPGELLIRGPQVMKGYLNQPQATAGMLSPDGWLRTGDVAVAHADGTYSIVDRVKELIKYKGYQVAPAELEAELLTHPEIADAAVIGIPWEGDEAPKAFVVRSPGSEVTSEEVLAYIAGRVAPHKRVRVVEFIDAIPKSASGKILRKELRGA
ncbi:AMP-binding protein [Nonomuraea lactucae]|uniref:AMP-binding protein n=1 Tax=Nonomuraea lactucae TaxID=2249762 RepID=UPI000DE3DFD9|nr:AMP-binding protein [Nonomuraea lactucae]